MSGDRDFIERETKKYFQSISEHCVGIRVFVVSPDGDDCSSSFSQGTGEWYAQYGVVREWLLTQDEKIRHNARSEARGDS